LAPSQAAAGRFEPVRPHENRSDIAVTDRRSDVGSCSPWVGKLADRSA
jgi:hypothetical protein